MITMAPSTAPAPGGGGGAAGASASGAGAALHTMLSQLSFTSEIPSCTTTNNLEPQDAPSFLLWNGFFCLSFENDELFYDAYQQLEEDPHHHYTPNKVNSSDSDSDVYSDSDTTSESTTSILALRGGEQPPQHHSLGESFVSGANVQQPQHKPQSPPASRHHHHQMQHGHNDRDDDMINANTQSYSSQSRETPFSHTIIITPPPPPPQELPDRFLRAGKGDPEEGQRRYEATLQWRQEHAIDTILLESHPDFELIKANYPHYYHLRGRNGEPVFFEQPPKTNLAAMRRGGVTLDGLLRHYAMITEFQWQFIERDDHARSITIFDLEGMRMMDFVGECVEYVRKCSAFTGQHYPERASYVLVINVPGWFQMIWNVVKPMVDEVTLEKIMILKRDKEQILQAMLEKIPMENIPPEYGGQSMPLGESPQEELLRNLMRHNQQLSTLDENCPCGGRPHCRFCSFVPVRSY